MLVELAGRTIHVKASPIGIPFDRFVQLAQTAGRFLKDTENVKIIIGVDRLDYTKGTILLMPPPPSLDKSNTDFKKGNGTQRDNVS